MPVTDNPLVQLLPYIAAILLIIGKRMDLLGKAAEYMLAKDTAKVAPQTNGNGLALATVTFSGVDRQLGLAFDTLSQLRTDFFSFREDCDRKQREMLARIEALEKTPVIVETPKSEATEVKIQ